MSKLIVVAAQMEPVRGDIETNIATHLRFIDAAASQGANLIVFPELSLTGYEPDLGPELQLEPCDPRIDPIKHASEHYALNILIGAPWRAGHNKPYIGAFVFSPQQVRCYAKIHVSENESRYFGVGSESCVISFNGVRTGVAICADTGFASHAAAAAGHVARLCAASVMKDDEEYLVHVGNMGRHAGQHKMAALTANYSGYSGGVESAGKSAAWDASGKLLAQARQEGEAMVIGRYDSSKWTGDVLAI